MCKDEFEVIEDFEDKPSNIWTDLEESAEEIERQAREAEAARREEERNTCPKCNGTGQWYRGVNRYGNSKCHACNGRGWFQSSPEERRRRRERRAERKAKLVADNMADNVTKIGGQSNWERFVAAGEWSEFARDLADKGRRLLWTERQVNSICSMLAKLEAKEAAKVEAKKAEQVKVDLSPIKAMFDAAVASGLKAPKYRAEGLVINRAPSHGNNPGALYVKSDETGDYGGKVFDGKFTPSRTGKAKNFSSYSIDLDGEAVHIEQTAAQALLKIAENPNAAAVRYGMLTGRCACCGRELTNYESIQRGVGPVCAEKWGLGDVEWGYDPRKAKEDLKALAEKYLN